VLGRDANPGIQELSAVVVPTWPLSLVASLQKEKFVVYCEIEHTALMHCIKLNVRIFHGTANPNRTLHEHDDVSQEIIISFCHTDSAVREWQLTVFCWTALRHAMSTLWMHKIPLSDKIILLAGFICCYKTSVQYICCQPLLLRTNYQVIFRNKNCSIRYQ